MVTGSTADAKPKPPGDVPGVPVTLKTERWKRARVFLPLEVVGTPEDTDLQGKAACQKKSERIQGCWSKLQIRWV